MSTPTATYLLIALCLAILALAATDEAPGGCRTDTECAATCPASDKTCDGGPQP